MLSNFFARTRSHKLIRGFSNGFCRNVSVCLRCNQKFNLSVNGDWPAGCPISDRKRDLWLRDPATGHLRGDVAHFKYSSDGGCTCVKL